MRMPRFLIRATALFLLVPAVGCQHSLTGKLWSSDGFAHFREPAAEPHVEVFYTPEFNDFLVAYDSVRDGGEEPRRQTYLAIANERNIWNRKMPRLLSTNGLNLVSVPLNGETNVLPYATYDQSLTIYTTGERLGPYPLPNYKETDGIAAKTALTPLAVTGDVSIAAAIVGLLAFIAWCESGASCAVD